MSIFSSRTSSSQPYSILKKPSSLKSRLNQIRQTPTKVRFVLPHAKKVHQILQNFVKNNSTKDYEHLVCLIRDAELLDEDISSLLKEATGCISLLNQDLRLFVEALFSVDWTNRNKSVVSEYQSFIVNLLSAHNYHSKYVVDKLVSLFVPGVNEPEWPNGIPSKSDNIKCSNIHSLLSVLLTVVPMCKELLMTSLQKYFPYYTRPVHMHEYYLHNLLRILEYQPSFRSSIFYLIFSKLIILDVNAPREEILKTLNVDDEIFMMETDYKSVCTSSTLVNRQSVGYTLDVCMEKMFNYFIKECHHTETNELDWNNTKRLYHDCITVFDRVILPTYNIHHVQFIMFLLCSFKPSLTEAYLNYLWKKVCNPNVARILRQTSVTYIASLIARATFVPLSMLKGTLQQMAEWIHAYISNQDGLECVNSDVRVHTVFYSICQSLFYIVVFRHKELVDKKKNIVFLESLNVAKIITCRLNPLRVCQPAVVQNFAAITRKYQLAYCYSVMEHNARNRMPTLYPTETGMVITSDNVLDVFFPFDPYILTRSSNKIQEFYRDFQHEDVVEKNCEQDTTEFDDFLDQHQELSSSFNNKSSQFDKFSYSSSPGFKFKS